MMRRPLTSALIPATLAAVMGMTSTLAGAADLVGARLITNGKDAAVLRVELSAPGVAGVSWGEEPMAWTGSAVAPAPATTHELRLAPLAADRRVFYQVEVDGAPTGDIATFTSGRSWVTRRAVVQVTAAEPSASAEDEALASRLFARESDALVLLGGEGDAAAFASQHGRAMGDRLVLTGPDQPAASVTVADVLLGWPGVDLAAEAETHGACWTVGLGHGGASGADVVLARAATTSVTTMAGRLLITLAGRDVATLSFAAGALTATVTSPDGSETTRTLSKTCRVPGAPAPGTTPAATTDDGEPAESNMDGAPHDADCDTP